MRSEVAGLFKASGFLMSAGLALVVGFLGPGRDNKHPNARMLTRLAGLLTAVATGLIWTLLADTNRRQALIALAIACSLLTVGMFIVYDRALRAGPRRTATHIYFLLLAISGPIALSATALMIMLPKLPEVSIVVPRADDCFSPGSQVEGTWRNFPPNSDIWIASATLDGQIMFPEDHRANMFPNGRWESPLSYRPPASATGFYIRALLLNDQGRKTLGAYGQDPARMGLRGVPEGAVIADRITIRTGTGCPVIK